MRILIVFLVLLGGCLEADQTEHLDASGTNTGTNTATESSNGGATSGTVDEPTPDPDPEPEPEPREPEILWDSNGSVVGDAHAKTPAGSAGAWGVTTGGSADVRVQGATRLVLDLNWTSTGAGDLDLFAEGPGENDFSVQEGNVSSPDNPIQLIIDDPADGDWDLVVRSSGIATKVDFQVVATAYYD